MENIEQVHRDYIKGKSNEHRGKAMVIDAILKSIQADPPSLTDERLTLLDECIAAIDVKVLYAPNRDKVNRLRKVLEMHRFYRKGKTLEQLGEWYGISRQGIHKSFIRYGLPTRPIHESNLDVQTNNN